MRFFRKNLFSFVTFSLLAFFLVLAMEASHHHDNLEGHDDCSLCAWQLTGSNAPSAPKPPTLFHSPVFVSLVVFTPLLFVSSFESFPSVGRAPPSILL
ncbi:MAG TPA: hypothetical protein VMV05_09355 [bacterium]|nr:hypothetical protein [bacterium]